MNFESSNDTELSFTTRSFKNVDPAAPHLKYNPVSCGSWMVVACCRRVRGRYRKVEIFYRDEGYLDVKVFIGHGADKVLASPEYEALGRSVSSPVAMRRPWRIWMTPSAGWKILGRMMTSASWIAWLKSRRPLGRCGGRFG